MLWNTVFIKDYETQIENHSFYSSKFCLFQRHISITMKNLRDGLNQPSGKFQSDYSDPNSSPWQAYLYISTRRNQRNLHGSSRDWKSNTNPEDYFFY